MRIRISFAFIRTSHSHVNRMKQLLLIDSHALLHRFFHALPPLTSPTGEPVGGIYGLCGVVLKMVAPPAGGARPDYIAAALDRPEPTFRAKMFADYKIQRPPAPDPLISQIKRLPETFEHFNMRTLSVPGFEADDIIGTLAERFKNEPDLQIVILSGDLDVMQLVDDDKVVVDLIKRGTSDVMRYNEAAVVERYGLKPSQLPDYKGLVGDTSDNIPGVTGIGAKGASELLKEFGSIEQLYEDIGLVKRSFAEKLESQKEIALSSKQLAVIRRDAPIEINSLEEFRAAPPDRAKLVPFFESLGFQSLINRLP